MTPTQMEATAGAVIVDGSDYSAIMRAIDIAMSFPETYADGPDGQPQHTIYLRSSAMTGSRYSFANVYTPSHLRIEIDAGAVLQALPNKDAKYERTPMFISGDTLDTSLVSGVSIVGIGRDWLSMKNRFVTKSDRVAAAYSQYVALGYDLHDCFVFNSDPLTANCNNICPFWLLGNVDGWLLENLFSIQGADPTIADATNGQAFWPNSNTAVILPHATRDSPLGDASLYKMPRNGTIRNHVNSNSPRGYGPNQLNASDGLLVRGIFSEGGTALRCETDGSYTSDAQAKNGIFMDRGAVLMNVDADDIVSVEGNRGVSFSPHAQYNGTVRVGKVYAYSPNQGAVVSRDHLLPGGFESSTIENLFVYGGDRAQIDGGSFAWSYGQSVSEFAVDSRIPTNWHYSISLALRAGTFTRPVK